MTPQRLRLDKVGTPRVSENSLSLYGVTLFRLVLPNDIIINFALPCTPCLSPESAPPSV